MKKKLLLLVAMFSVAIGTVSINRASALTNTQISGTSGQRWGLFTSNDGRYISFLSDGGSGLVSGLLSGHTYGFLRDTQSSTTSLLTKDSSGNPIADVNYMVLSHNGRYAVFTSAVGGMPTVVYLRDLQSGTTSQITTSYSQLRGEAVSEDGRFVYYVSGHALQMSDQLLSTTTRIDVNSSGTGTAGVDDAQVSTTCDGRFVVFASTASDLVSSDSNGYSDIFLVDSMNGHAIKNITVGADNYSSLPSITCDGNYIVFESSASNLITGDTNSAQDIFEYNVQSGSTQLVNVDPSGAQYGSPSSSMGGLNTTPGGNRMSMDGRYIIFAIDKFTAGTETSGQIFLRDMVAGTTTSLSPAYAFADWPTMTYDGRKIYYGYTTYSSQRLSRNIYSATNYL